MASRRVKKEKYVTKGEFDEAMSIVNKSFEHVATKEQLQEVSDQLNDRVEKVEDTGKTILEIVKTIDANTKNLRDIPERVAKLEEDVFRLKLQRNRK